MGKSKEETRLEKVIRGLLKLPDNRRCINCKNLGPQYVCTTFWTFVCTTCSGVHREFSHRVKSISMAKFTSEEVSALQAGGNERAKQDYLRTWDTQRNIFPDNSNIHKLRDFIKHVYVERRYTGETNPALAPRLRNIDNEEPYEHRSRDTSEKPSFHERNIDRYGKFSFKEPRFGYDRENDSRSNGGLRRGSSCGLYEVDNARIAGRSATAMFTTADLKSTARARSPDPPVPVHHVREILGDNFQRLRVEDLPKPSEKRNFNASASNVQVEGQSKESNISVDGCSTRGQEGSTQKSAGHSGNLPKRRASASAQNVAQSNNQAVVNPENAEVKVKVKGASAETMVNFVNFPSPEASLEQGQGARVANAGGNLSSQNPAEDTIRNTPAKNTLEYLLFELSAPVSTPSNNDTGIFASIGKAKDSPTRTRTPTPQQPQEHSVITVLDSPATTSIACGHSNGVIDNQPDEILIAPSIAAPPIKEQNSASTAECSIEEMESGGRTELPADMFSLFNPPGPLAAWQMVPSNGMGFDMNYHSTCMVNPQLQLVPGFQSVTRSRNPFDIDDYTTQHNATNTMFPSMLSLQGGFPNPSTPEDVSHTSTFGSNPSVFVPMPSSSYSSGAYMGHPLYSNMPPTRLQGTSSGYDDQEGIPGSWISHQQTLYTYPTHTSTNSSFHNTGGNPFG